jgi:hypothetical protein
VPVLNIYPAAVWRPGPAGKIWPGANACEGIIEHSAQGSLAGAWSVLDDVSADADGRYLAASWHFTIAKDGTVYQHYGLDRSPFHAGTKTQNLRLIGVEHEGGPPGNLAEPLTEAQIQASVLLARWIAEQGAFTLAREPAVRTLYEHRELWGTECPSGRVPWDHYVGIADPYPVPLAYFTWRGKGEQAWQNIWELRVVTTQPNTNILLTREGREHGTDEVMRVVVEDWVGG